MRGPRVRPGAGGFTLLETVVSLGIALVILASLAGAQGHQARFVAERAREDAARRACAARLEALLADRSLLSPGTRAVALPAEAGSLLGAATGEETIAAAEEGLHAVEVRVRWTAAGGEPRSTSLATLIAGRSGR